MQRIFKIRYNTDFPHISNYPWRVIEVGNGEWIEVLTMHVSMHTASETSIDILPDGRLKYHISLCTEHVVFGTENDDQCFEKIEFFESANQSKQIG